MHPGTHLLAGWTLANVAELSNRDRAIVTAACVVPDLDGIGIVVELATRNASEPLLWYSSYHHLAGHNIGFALLCSLIALALADRKWLTAALTFLSFHLHLLGDLVGSRGTDGYQWPIPYLEPFSDAWQLTWSGQWLLSSWQNNAITVLLMVTAIFLAWRQGFSPLAMVWSSGDRVFVDTLRARFGEPTQE
jgi:hypothetical protein